MPTNKHEDKLNLFPFLYTEVTPSFIHSPLHISKTPMDKDRNRSSVTVLVDWEVQTHAQKAEPKAGLHSGYIQRRVHQQ
jgi:hypothetical protein